MSHSHVRFILVYFLSTCSFQGFSEVKIFILQHLSVQRSGTGKVECFYFVFIYVKKFWMYAVRFKSWWTESNEPVIAVKCTSVSCSSVRLFHMCFEIEEECSWMTAVQESTPEGLQVTVITWQIWCRSVECFVIGQVSISLQPLQLTNKGLGKKNWFGERDATISTFPLAGSRVVSRVVDKCLHY